MNERLKMADRSPTFEVIQRAPMLFDEHLRNINALLPAP
jgi:hypothetical protein